MCHAKATLAYGLTVRSSSLVFAADAWTRLKHSFRFFQLVSSVVVREDSSVPLETEEDQSRKYRMNYGRRSATGSFKKRSNSQRKTYSILSSAKILAVKLDLPPTFRRSGATWNAALAAKDATNHFKIGCLTTFPTGKRAESLPAQFDENEPDSNTLALALIAAPSKFQEDRFEESVIESQASSAGGSGSTIVDVSFQDLPSNIDLRFKRFIDLFDLVVVDSATSNLSPRTSGPVGRIPGRRRSKHPVSGMKDQVTEEIQPRWKLFMESTCCCG
ncbi:hypothetical protein JCM3765_001853 [Sporobolomyces pararoseus]